MIDIIPEANRAEEAESKQDKKTTRKNYVMNDNNSDYLEMQMRSPMQQRVPPLYDAMSTSTVANNFNQMNNTHSMFQGGNMNT